MDNRGAAHPGENFERAEESARSSYTDTNNEEVMAYTTGTRDQRASARDFDRREMWKEVWHYLRLAMLIIAILVGLIFIIAVVALVLWLVWILVVHYTIPAGGWLTTNELGTLGNLYSGVTRVIAPTALIVNAWFVAYFSYRRLRSDNRRQTGQRPGDSETL